MPITYFVDDVKKLIYTRVEGIITFKDLKAHINADVCSASLNCGEIFDCTDATTNITPQQIIDLAKARSLLAQVQTPFPVAVVATNDNFFGMMRMFESYTDEIRPIRIFRKVYEAEDWINLIKSYE